MKPPTPSPGSGIPFFTLGLLCFLQSLTDFVESTYAFGLLQIGIPVETASLILMVAPLVLLPFRRVPDGWLAIAGGLFFLSRAASLVMDSHGRMLAAGTATGLGLVVFPLGLWVLGARRPRAFGASTGAALALATLLYLLLRALGSGNDVSGLGAGRLLGILLAGAGGVLGWRWFRSLPATGPEPAGDGLRMSAGRATVGCVGLMAPLALLHLGCATPTVVTRWTEGSYFWITVLVAGSMVLFLFAWRAAPGWWGELSWWVWLAWNILFVTALALTLWAGQVTLPPIAAAYPVAESPVPGWGRFSLAMALLLAPVLLVNFARFAQALVDERPSLRGLGVGASLSALGLLLAILAQVFTTVYDYIPVVGPWFRDRFWWVGLAIGVVMVLPVFWLSWGPRVSLRDMSPAGSTGVLAAGVAMAAVAVAAVAIGSARPAAAAPKASLRVMTFNIQQGYSAQGSRNLDGQLELIRRTAPDLIGLQESDSARVAGGNSDAVRYLADRLNFHSYYGPRTVSGTFGVALLSRYPIQEARTLYLESAGEQTAVIAAVVPVGNTAWRVFVTHLGNGGPVTEQRGLLREVAGRTNVILTGDFNSAPGEGSYQLATQHLEDAWLAAGERRVDPGGLSLKDRIDHVFVSAGTRVLQADYWGPGASDHPVLTVEIEAASSR